MRDLARSHGVKGPVGVFAGAAGGGLTRTVGWSRLTGSQLYCVSGEGTRSPPGRACRYSRSGRGISGRFPASSCYRNLGENDKAYRVWDLRCIPCLDPVDNNRRRDWVKRNVEDAESRSGTNNNTNHQSLCDNTRFFYAIRLICSI